VLTQLDDLDGVEGSFVNEDGSKMRLTLKDGADREKVAREAERILDQEVPEKDRVPRDKESSPLFGKAADHAEKQEHWKDSKQVAQLAADVRRAESRRLWLWLLALLVTLVVGLLGWRQWQRRPATVVATS
jgi:hypothetical protein